MFGRKKLQAVLKALDALVDANPCGMSDEQLSKMADDIQYLIDIKHRQEVSREEAAVMLGISTRSFRRLVIEGKIPQGHRNGHKELSWYVDDIIKLK